MKNKIYYNLTFLLLLVFYPAIIYSQSFSSFSYVISDITERPITEFTIPNELAITNGGLSVKLIYDTDDSKIYVTSKEYNISFETLSNYLISAIERDPDRIFPIFIDYSGPEQELINAFNKTGLSNILYYLPTGERWPAINEMAEKKKNLVIFTFQKMSPYNNLFHYVWDYVSEYPHYKIGSLLFNGEYKNGDINNELLAITDLTQPSENESQENILTYFDQTQYYINYLLERWDNSGKQPNFIFAKRNAYSLTMIIYWIITYKGINGIVYYDGKPMDKVLWEHSIQSITNGFFSFPITEGESKTLTPYKPGYTFSPSSVYITDQNYSTLLEFHAEPIDIHDKIKGYFTFNNVWENELNKKKEINPVNISFATDTERGTVAKITDSSYINIGYPKDYGMINNSFTVSAWVKVVESDPARDFCLLGTNEASYRKGLHLLIRNNSPYFGFWGNDTETQEKVNLMEWFHIVFRYDYFNGEQSIFLNGENIESSLNHLSFIGDSSLLIGKFATNGIPSLIGYMDDLYIWDRPLGEQEIKTLYSSTFIPEIKPDNNIYIYSGSLLIIFILGISVIYYTKRKKRAKNKVPEIEQLALVLQPEKNSLYLFGDFQVFDENKNELSAHFTPKIKELFLLIIIYTIQNGKGIKTEELTSYLWPDFQSIKAANNRSVTFNKLRKNINDVKGLNIIYKHGYWKAVFEDPFYCDYLKAYTILEQKNNSSEKELQSLYRIVKRGVFLNDIYWDWLDEPKGYITNEIIDNLLRYASKIDPSKNGSLLDSLAKRILSIDDLNEKGLQILVKNMIDNDNLNLAKYKFNQFTQKYKEAYGEDYKLGFEKFLMQEF